MESSSLRTRFLGSALWRDALGIPSALQRTLDERRGFTEVSQLLSQPHVRRVLVTGNGAAYYVALAAATASLGLGGHAPEWVAVPAGLFASGSLRFGPADVVLVVSSSGELKDVLAALAVDRLPRPFALITGKPQSSIARQAGAVALAHVDAQTAVTHTQAYASNLGVVFSLLAASFGSTELEQQLAGAPRLCAVALAQAQPWALGEAPQLAESRAAVVAATGLGLSAALEAALLLKEVAEMPAEGLESREAATSGMYALSPGQLLLGLSLGQDPVLAETCAVCKARGATTLLAPGGELGPESLLPLTSFPAALALSLGIGLERGLDVDRPAWADAYYATARVAH